MMRSLGPVLSCTALSFVLTACGADTEDSPSRTPEPDPATTTPSAPVSTPTSTTPQPSAPASAPGSGAPSRQSSSGVTSSARPTPTTTDITEDMGPGEHDMDAE